MFEIAMALSITHVSMCHTILRSFPVPYSMLISEFSLPNSKNRFAVAALFSLFYPCAIIARFGEKLQNPIEPVIRNFIDCMEPDIPRIEIESCHRGNNGLVLIHLKKSLSEEKALFKAGFNILSENDIRYLQQFLNDIFLQWRFWHPSQEEDSTDSFSDSSSSIILD